MSRALITASHTSAIGAAPNFRTLHTMANGKRVAITEGSGSTSPHYWTSSDGITWTDIGVLPSASFAFSACMHAEVITVSGIEKLVIWYVPTGVAGLHPGNPDCYAYTATWDGTGLFTSGATVSYSPLSYGSTYTSLAAVYDSGIWHLALNVGVSGLQVGFFAISGSSVIYNEFAAGGSVTTFLISTGSATLTLNLVKAGATFVLTAQDTYRNQITAFPYTWSGSAYALGAGIERVAAGASYHTATVDTAGLVDILYADGGTALRHKKRTGTNIYTLPTWLANLNPSQPQFSVAHDTSNDDLWAIYDTSASQTNGELAVRRRKGATWLDPALIDGGDASGYQWPKLSSTVTTAGSEVLYLVGTSTTRSLYVLGVSGGSAPNAPTNLTTGYVAGITPTLHADYSNSAVNDPKGGRQIEAYDSGGLAGTLMWDSGQVNGTAVDSTYAGSTLTYGATYYWRARDLDSITNTGAGTYGPWSSLVPFVPAHSGTVTIDDVYSAGAASSSTIASGTLQIDLSYAHPDADDASAYRTLLYEADGVTLHATTGWVPLSLALASGGTLRTNAWTPGVVNGQTYYLQQQLQDATNGLISSSSLDSYTVSFTPPPAPSGFTVTPNADLGTADGAWTNGSGAVSSVVQYKKSAGSAWITTSGTGLVTSFSLHPNTTISFDYRVAYVDANGLQSAWATQTGVTLPGYGSEEWGIWLTDIDSLVSVPLGPVDAYSDLVWQQFEDEMTYLPVGGQYTKASYGKGDYEWADSLKFFIPAQTQDSSGAVVEGSDLVAKLRAMQAKYGRRLLWRDPKGRVTYCRMTLFKDQPDEDVNWHVEFKLMGIRPPNPPVY